MNKILHIKKVSHKILLSMGVVAAILIISLVGIQGAQAMITNQLDLGSTGSDVTEVQTYYSGDASIYPSGLITGYFGPLTQSATQKFQTMQGIVSSGSAETTGYGRVGPQTIIRLNSLIGSGYVQTYTNPAPLLSGTLVQHNGTAVSLSWNTNEPTQGQVYFSTSPLLLSEQTTPTDLAYVSGSLASDGAGLQMSHAVTIQNLQPNTTYYYLTRGIDSVGNMSMTWPATFNTSQ
ncbi:MAG: fibronectin type III domain-containing protein [Candidatus Paceibacterota bacterium]